MLGHELAGEVVELGAGVTGLHVGDQVYVTDGGQNHIWRADIDTGAVSVLAVVLVAVAVGDRVEAGNACAVVESVKAASDVYSPVAGEVVEVAGSAPGVKAPRRP